MSSFLNRAAHLLNLVIVQLLNDWLEEFCEQFVALGVARHETHRVIRVLHAANRGNTRTGERERESESERARNKSKRQRAEDEARIQERLDTGTARVLSCDQRTCELGPGNATLPECVCARAYV